jgi:hypothetical protein
VSLTNYVVELLIVAYRSLTSVSPTSLSEWQPFVLVGGLLRVAVALKGGGTGRLLANEPHAQGHLHVQ